MRLTLANALSALLVNALLLAAAGAGDVNYATGLPPEHVIVITAFWIA